LVDRVPTILIVDDEPSIVEALRGLLCDEGYRIVSAPNGADGLQRMKDERPALAMIDVMMPVLDGQELLHLIRATPGLEELPVIMMSAAPRSAMSENTPPHAAFLRKPFDLPKLLETIMRLAGPGSVANSPR
jgi:CheY-like chemotaxis protein